MAKLNIQWNQIGSALQKGVGLAKMQLKPNQKKLYASPNSEIVYKSALSTGQIHGLLHNYGILNGLGQDASVPVAAPAPSSDYISRIKTGELFPDQVMGWSTKSILIALLILMILKVQRCG